MFYQLYGSQGANVRTPNPIIPLIIWIEGGPGATSQFGAHK
jgi:carboxypeptidase C (cathepsin A)